MASRRDRQIWTFRRSVERDGYVPSYESGGDAPALHVLSGRVELLDEQAALHEGHEDEVRVLGEAVEGVREDREEGPKFEEGGRE